MSPQRPRDAGVTLVELIVTMALLGVVTALILGVTVAFSRTFTEDRSLSDSTMVASQGMNELTRVVRSGTELQVSGMADQQPVFVTAQANELTLYAYIDTDATDPRPVRVRFSIDADRRLTETRWLATNTAAPWTFQTGAGSTRTIARSIPTGADPLFTYLLGENGVETPVPGGGFSTAQLRDIRAVEVRLTVQADVTSRADAVTIENAVGIPNLGKPRVRP